MARVEDHLEYLGEALPSAGLPIIHDTARPKYALQWRQQGGGRVKYKE
jgi:hypothetical protein